MNWPFSFILLPISDKKHEYFNLANVLADARDALNTSTLRCLLPAANQSPTIKKSSGIFTTEQSPTVNTKSGQQKSGSVN